MDRFREWMPNRTTWLLCAANLWIVMVSKTKSSNGKQGEATDQSPPMLSPLWRKALSAIIALHGSIVFISLSSGLAEYALSDVQPSQLQYALTNVLSLYTETLHIDIFAKPYYLTYGRVDLDAAQVEGDYRVEVLPTGKDATIDAYWKPISEIGPPGGAPQRRFEALCTRVNFYNTLESHDITGKIARQVAIAWRAETGDAPARVRVRRHLLLSADQVQQGVNADDPLLFKTVYEAYVIVSGDDIEVSRTDAISKVAIPE